MSVIIYNCPECGSDQIGVWMATWVKVEQTPAPTHSEVEIKTEKLDAFDVYRDSEMLCRSCGHKAPAHTFDGRESRL